MSRSREHYGLLGECECTELIQISVHHLFKYVILYQRITWESWPKRCCWGISSGSWITGNWKAVFVKWRSDFRFSLSLSCSQGKSLWMHPVANICLNHEDAAFTPCLSSGCLRSLAKSLSPSLTRSLRKERKAAREKVNCGSSIPQNGKLQRWEN